MQPPSQTLVVIHLQHNNSWTVDTAIHTFTANGTFTIN
jgi:hypothetical protein